jgi:hypothetical protein
MWGDIFSSNALTNMPLLKRIEKRGGIIKQADAGASAC